MLRAVVRGSLTVSLIATGTRDDAIALDKRLACPLPSAPAIGYLVQIVGACYRPRLPSWHDDPGALLMGIAHVNGKNREPGDQDKQRDDPGG